MSDKLTKDGARTKFRSSVAITGISETLMHPDFDYKWVDLQFTEGLKRVDRYIDMGWEVIYSKDKPKDDRKNNANQDGEEKDLRTSPVTRTTRGGHTQIYMKILKSERNKNALAKEVKDTARANASRNLKRTGNTITVTESVDVNKLSD